MQEKTIVCSVFEGHYHKGVAALVNSLYAAGYEGTVWLGYKGALPPWAVIAATENGVDVMHVRENLTLRFIKFPPTAFLPYCKPDFMLELLEKYAPKAEHIFYLDCDIVVKCDFSYFEEWVTYGITLCEDVNSPLPVSHPLRHQWAQHFKKHNIEVRRNNSQYVNGGFIGLSRAAKGFLDTWRHIQNLVLEDMQRIKADLHASHKPDKMSGLKDRTYMFYRTDQDALNIAKDVTDETLSIVDGKEMDFGGFGFIMSHAESKSKPWEKNWLAHVIKKGHRPGATDRIFMNHTQNPINIYASSERMLRKMHLKLAVAIARIIA
jgi:hypothetical protein